LNGDIVIEASNLTKRFNGLVAVDHVNFEVRRGEIFGFLGPNGAGKTTTIRMFTGIIKPDEGSASILGYDIVREGLEAKEKMGIVPEMANAYVDLSAWDNLMLIGQLYGVPKRLREERALRLLKDLGLYERRKHIVKSFSKGMKQKLLLCMALINDPQILFLDEPTSGLDVESQRLIRGKIREFNNDGVTVFLTTHNMNEANQLCDRIAIINKGKIVAIDSPEKLKLQSSGLQSIVLGFDKPVDIRDLLVIEGVEEVEKMGDKIKLKVKNSSSVIERLVDYARLRKVKIISLNTLGPTLEEVFLQIVKEDGSRGKHLS